MPYRRLPKTDKARLKALETLLNNNDIYTARNRFIDWKVLNRAQPAYDKLFTACEQYRICMQTQVRHSPRIDKLQRNATIYISHFLSVLFMAVERGEIKKSYLPLYGLDAETTTLPNLKTIDGVIIWGKKVIEGERARMKKGGRAIYNPTIGMVATHYDIFKEAYENQSNLQRRTSKALEEIAKIRPEVDEILLELWNQIEAHFAELPPETRFNECRKLGVVYYYRRNEEHIY